MVHEKYFERSDGTNIKLRVFTTTTPITGQLYYTYTVFTRTKRQKIYRSLADQQPLSFHDLPFDKKVKHLEEECMKFVTEDELHEALLELHEKMTPTVKKCKPWVL